MLSSVPYILFASFLASGIAPEPYPDRSAYTFDSTGDHITLKSGKILHGVKILQESSLQLVLEVIPGIEPLIIPANQVAAIRYGEERIGFVEVPTETEDDDATPNVVPAVKTSPELIEKMDTALSDTAITYSEQDILDTLRAIGALSDVEISFQRELREVPEKERTLSIRLEAGASFDEFIRKTLASAAPWIAVQFEFDRLRFELHDTVEPPESGDEAVKSEKPDGDDSPAGPE